LLFIELDRTGGRTALINADQIIKVEYDTITGEGHRILEVQYSDGTKEEFLADTADWLYQVLGKHRSESNVRR
jgi:hypothetical protein